VAAALAALERAVAVTEAAAGGVEGDGGAGDAVDGAHLDDGLGDLLAVGADVLDRRRADVAGDAGEALEAGPALGDGAGDEVVPQLAGSGMHEDAVAGGFGGDAAQADAEDERVEAAVGDEEVRAAAEHEQGGAAGVSEGERVEDVGLGRGLGEPARGAADAEGGERRERDRLSDRERQGRPFPFSFPAGFGSGVAPFASTRMPAMKPLSTACTRSTNPL
jgi:hypothetical protein